MRKNKLLYVPLVLGVAVFFGFVTLPMLVCESQEDSVINLVQSRPVVGVEHIVFAPDSVITVGNHSYIPLNIAMDSSTINAKNATLILQVVDAFEQKHPEWKITDWRMEKWSRFLDGLWIDHEPREGLK
jgi:hypothetical protein